MILFVTLTCLFGSFAGDTRVLSPIETAAAPSEPFPIVSSFELPRDYGYFIGDEIPLTLIIEASKHVVLDLVNLPRQGEQHGLFEIRHSKLTSSTAADESKSYRVAYRLQYFGAAPLTARFEPLEILYARTTPRPPAAPRVSSYKTLLTQSVVINIARIGPSRPTQALDTKGPLDDRRSVLIWLPGLLGTSLLLGSIAGWTKEWRRARQEYRAAEPSLPTASEQALQSLSQTVVPLSSHDDPAPLVSMRLSHIIREYLQVTCGVTAYTLTPTELASRLNGTPYAEELLSLLQRCDVLKYQPHAADTEEQQLWEETLALFEQLNRRRLA